MAKLATLIDDFQDGVINASLWTADPGVTETGGRAKIVPSTSYPILQSVLPRSYDLTASQVVAYVPVTTSNGSTGTLQCGMGVDKDPNNFVTIRKVGSQLVCAKVVGGVDSNLSFTPYSAVNHLFWRIRTDSSNIYWETSATGTGYFIQHTENIATLGFAITIVGLYFFAGYTGVEPFPGTFQIEAVNPGLPITAAGASTSSGSLSLLTTSPLSITASGASTSTGSLALSLVAAANLYITSSALSTSTGALHFDVLGAGGITATGLSTSSGRLYLTTIAAPTLPGGTWFFEPPVAYDLPPTLPEPTRPRYLNAHAKWKGGQRRGRSVLKTNGVYTIIDTPTVDQMAAADIAYQGGHIYEISVQEAYELYLAGFNVYPATDILTTESGDPITTESGDILTAEYSFGSR